MCAPQLKLTHRILFFLLTNWTRSLCQKSKNRSRIYDDKPAGLGYACINICHALWSGGRHGAKIAWEQVQICERQRSSIVLFGYIVVAKKKIFFDRANKAYFTRYFFFLSVPGLIYLVWLVLAFCIFRYFLFVHARGFVFISRESRLWLN